MARIRFFADPDSTVIKTFLVRDPDGQIDPDTGDVLTEEHWLELRTELSDREWSDLELGIAPRATPSGELVLDLSGASFRQLAVWVKKWSLTGNLGGKSRPTEDEIGKLRQDVAKQIREIVEAHIEAMHEKRRAATNPTEQSDASRANGADPTTSTWPGGSETSVTTSLTATPPEGGSS